MCSVWGVKEKWIFLTQYVHTGAYNKRCVWHSCPPPQSPLPQSPPHHHFTSVSIMCDDQSKTLQNVLCNLRLARAPLGVSVSSVAQSCPTLCDPMNCSTPGLPVHHQLPQFTTELVMPSSHLMLCCPLLLLPTIHPSIRIFSNESTIHMRWPKSQMTIISTMVGRNPLEEME